MSEKRVSDLISERVAFTQLAEECTELAHSALKMARLVDPEQRENMGNVDESKILENFIEEFGDVLCCGEVAFNSKSLSAIVMLEDLIMESRDRKYQRWLERLTNK